MAVPRKKNIAGYIDEQGRFRPIRKPSFVGSKKRKATAKDRKKYSRAKAGDLGQRKQFFAREDVFDREARKRREHDEKMARAQAREMRKIERESLGDQDESGPGRTLVEFVRSSGGIRPTYRHGGKKYRGKRSSYDFGELQPFTLKESGKRGLVSEKGKYSVDGMFQAAKEAGYAVSDPWDLLNAMDDEIRSGKAMNANYGYLDYRDNPKSDLFVSRLGPRSFGVFLKTYLLKKFTTKAAADNYLRSVRSKAKANPSAIRAAKAAISIFDNDLDLDVDEKDLRRLQAATRKLASRRKNGGRSIKRNPVGWFRDVSPVTPDAVKKLYRTLAAKYHPDKGGDTRSMQEINADYAKAMKIAISGEGNAARAKAETAAVEPLREAIEFAVTLPDDVKVVIRGLWLWIEGNTFKAKDQIKSFKSSDGNHFKWAPKKKAWFFAAVPSSNRRGEMSFAEIEALHGRQDVTERKRRFSLNPADPLTTFAMAAGGIASALQIKQMLNADDGRAKRKKNGTTPAKRGKAVTNPAGVGSGAKHNEKLFDRELAAIEEGNFRVVRSATAHGRLAGYSKAEVDWLIKRAKLASRLKAKLNPAKLKTEMKRFKANPDRCLKCRKMTAEGVLWSNGGFCNSCESKLRQKKTRARKKAVAGSRKANPRKRKYSATPAADRKTALKWLSQEVYSRPELRGKLSVQKQGEYYYLVYATEKANPAKPRRSRLFEKFQGRSVTSAVRRPASVHAPAKLAQLGDLIEIHLKGGKILKLNPQKFKLTAANGKLWIVGGKFANANPAGKANEINPIGELSHVVYGTRKPHHGDHSYTHYIHKMGEESGKRPLLCVDRDGYPVLRGGNYKIEARGIVD